jgi:hypothetical protein
MNQTGKQSQTRVTSMAKADGRAEISITWNFAVSDEDTWERIAAAIAEATAEPPGRKRKATAAMRTRLAELTSQHTAREAAARSARLQRSSSEPEASSAVH